MAVCECGKEFKNGRALAAHRRFHCTGLQQRAAVECDAGHSWRFLDRDDPHEYHAIKYGYKKICEECEEII